MELQLIEIPEESPEITGSASLIFIPESESYYIVPDSYEGNIRNLLIIQSDSFYEEPSESLSKFKFRIIPESEYFYEQNNGSKLVISFNPRSDTAYIPSKGIGHLQLRFVLNSDYYQHGMPRVGKVRIDFFLSSDYIFDASRLGKTRVHFLLNSDTTLIDADRSLGRTRIGFTLNSDYIYDYNITRGNTRFILQVNSDTYSEDSDLLFRADTYLKGATVKFKAECNCNYLQEAITPPIIIPDENDMSYLQSMVEFIYDITALNTSDAIDMLIPVTCELDNQDLIYLEFPVTCSIQTPLCIEDIPVTCILVNSLAGYYSDYQEIVVDFVDSTVDTEEYLSRLVLSPALDSVYSFESVYLMTLNPRFKLKSYVINRR